MSYSSSGAMKWSAAGAAMVFDPTRPIQRRPLRMDDRGAAPGQNQRQRRATILATIRRLLIDEGFEGVTVRRVAECSGHAVQTIYNLVGTRNLAISEAISEYSQYVCLTETPDPRNPTASIAMIDRELDSIRMRPEFCRNVCMIFFSESREIFYDFRRRQVDVLHNFLLQQRKLGIIGSSTDVSGLAERMILSLGALFVEWADRPFSLDSLQERLYGTYACLMSDALSPAIGRLRLSQASSSGSSAIDVRI
jgi:AcrR family transcriptional regulator